MAHQLNLEVSEVVSAIRNPMCDGDKIVRERSNPAVLSGDGVVGGVSKFGKTGLDATNF